MREHTALQEIGLVRDGFESRVTCIECCPYSALGPRVDRVPFVSDSKGETRLSCGSQSKFRKKSLKRVGLVVRAQIVQRERERERERERATPLPFLPNSHLLCFSKS